MSATHQATRPVLRVRTGRIDSEMTSVVTVSLGEDFAASVVTAAPDVFRQAGGDPSAKDAPVGEARSLLVDRLRDDQDADLVELRSLLLSRLSRIRARRAMIRELSRESADGAEHFEESVVVGL
jgi:hypothetical protein